MKNCVTLKNATLGYKKAGKDICVLENINLSFNEAEFIGIVGLNGSGKSTLLKSLSGLLPLLGGDIFIHQTNLSQVSLNQLAKKVAVVLTEKIGGFNLTSFDTVAAGQIPYTNSFHQLNENHLAIIQSAIHACGIQEHQHKLLGELSDGLFQKTVIAKALAQQTPLLLLDEPSAFLDYASKHELFLLLKKLAEVQQKCVLVSSHDLDLLLKYCHKLIIVSDGKIEAIEVKDAKHNAAFVSVGGGFI